MGCGFGGLAWWDGGFRCMEMNKKSGGGDVRAKALSWDGEWDKAKNVFFGFIPLGPTRTHSDPLGPARTHGGSLCSPLTSPLPEKKPLRGKKVGFAEKKLCLRGAML